MVAAARWLSTIQWFESKQDEVKTYDMAVAHMKRSMAFDLK